MGDAIVTPKKKLSLGGKITELSGRTHTHPLKTPRTKFSMKNDPRTINGIK